MAHLEVIAHMMIRPGQLEGVRTKMAEIARLTREKDTRTLRYDVFLSDDGTECEVHEAYENEDGLLEHNEHVVEAREALFRDHAFDHRMSVYGEISEHLTVQFAKHAGGVIKFSLLQGLEHTTV